MFGENRGRSAKWNIYKKYEDGFTVIYRKTRKGVKYAPVYCLRIPLIPTNLPAAERFLRLNPDPDKLKRTADKIRFYRYQKKVLISDLASYVPLDRKTMSHYECAERKHYSMESLERIAEYLEVPVQKLLDDYTRFIYYGQGKTLKIYRKKYGMCQGDFAQKLKVSKSTIQKWEREEKCMSKNMFEKLSGLF